MNPTDNPVFSPTLKVKCDALLNGYTDDDHHLEFLSLSTSDGYILAHSRSESGLLNCRRISAMSSSLSGISIELAKETRNTNMEGSIIECETGFLICRLVRTDGIDAVLLGVFSKESNHGMALWTLKNIARSISEFLTVYK